MSVSLEVKEFIEGKKKFNKCNWFDHFIKDCFKVMENVKGMDDEMLKRLYNGYFMWKFNGMNRFSKFNRLLINVLGSQGNLDLDVLKNYDEKEVDFVMCIKDNGLGSYLVFERFVLDVLFGDDDKKDKFLSLSGSQVLEKKCVVCELMDLLKKGLEKKISKENVK